MRLFTSFADVLRSLYGSRLETPRLRDVHPTRLFAAIVAVAALVVVAPVASSKPASAAAADNFSLAKSNNVEGEATIGEEVTYTLTATGNHASASPLYNLSFSDVLPVGVDFVSADPAPSDVLVDVPAAGQTTVIWSNVSDLPANSQASVAITIDTNPDFAGGTTGSSTVPVGASTTNTAEAVASLDVFAIPDYSVTTGQFTGDFDGAASASDTVSIIPFRVEKEAGGELLRGVHANGVSGGGGSIGQLYTVRVENNPDYAVNSVTVVDTLDPGLEFLGCDTYYAADNTTVGEEWPGSGPVATGAGCGPTPDSVTTGPGGETIVTWTVGNLAPGQVALITYQAGIPMFENRPFTDPAPLATALTQGRNLDNNTGPSTAEGDRTVGADPDLLSAGEQILPNQATGTGVYTPTSVTSSASDIHNVESEDLLIGKSMNGALVQGTNVVSTLTIEASEYRNFSDLVVRDLMPSALCFLGGYNNDATPGGSDWRTTDCPGAGSVQSTINGVPVNVATVREIAAGGSYGTGRFELVWDFADPANAALASLSSDGSITITYSSVVREFYRGGLAQLTGEPVLAGDAVENSAEVSGPGFLAGATLPAETGDPDAGVDGDTASSSIDNALPTLNKRVSAKAGPMANGQAITGATCSDSYGAITWSEGDPTPEMGFGPGDIVCFEVGASFAANVDYEGVKLVDIMPAGYEYVAGSAARVGSIDTMSDSSAVGSPSLVSFTVGSGGNVESTGNEFLWVIAAELSDNADGVANDINTNLLKMTHNNNGGLVYQLRDQAAAVWTEPEVRLAKGVDNVNGGASNGADHDGSLAGGSTAVTVRAADVVEFRLDVWNEGNADALSTEVQDHLPADFTCLDVSGISDGGVCSAGVITWTGLTIDSSTGGTDLTPDTASTASTSLRYSLTIPTGIDPGRAWTNTAGVASYQAATNAGGVYEYYPAGNIDSTNTALENTDAASDVGYIETPTLVITKAQKSGIDEAGNGSNASLGTSDDQGTIGEIVQYAVTIVIPEGTTVYNAEIRDSLPAGLSWFTGNGLFNGTVSNLQPTATSSTGTTALTLGIVAHSGGLVTYELPDPYSNPGLSGDDEVTITLYAQVDDIVANDADPTPTVFANSGRFRWDDSSGTTRPDTVSNTVNTYVVEPNPTIAKDHTAPTGSLALPGETVTYRITAANPASATNVSLAHDVTIVDDVPIGLTPVAVGGLPAASNGDLIPSTGVVPAGAFNGVWSQANRTITWTPTEWASLESIAPNATAQFTYDATVDDPAVASSSIVNDVALTAYSLDQNRLVTVDPNEGDARSYAAADDDTITVPLAGITKDIEPFNDLAPLDDITSLTVGQPADFEVEVVVPSGTVAYDATIFDTLPASLDFDSFATPVVSASCEVFQGGASTGSSLVAGDVETFNPVGANGQLLAWFAGDIYANGDCTITLPYTVHVNDNAASGDSVSNNASLVWNNADQVVDQAPTALPAGYNSPSSSSWSISAGPASQTFAVTEPAVAIDKDVANVSGAALATPACDTTPGNNTAGSNDNDGLSGNGCDTTAGASLRYTVTATSAGTSAASDLTIVDTVPAGLTPLASVGGAGVSINGDTVTGASGSIGTWSETDRTITWAIVGPLAPTTTAMVDYDATVDASDTLTRGIELTNTADVATFFGLTSAERTQIVADNSANNDIITYGNGAGATRGNATADDVTVEVHFPDLAVTKNETAGQDFTDARLNQPYSWTITVTNTDPVASAYNVDVTDTLPAGWTYDAGSALVTTPHNGGSVAVEPTCSADSGSCGDAAALNVESLVWTDLVSTLGQPLAPGQTITVVLTATPQSAALTPDQATGETYTGFDGGGGFAHTNNVVVTGEDASGSSTCCDPDGPGGADPETYTASDNDDAYIARADITVDKAITPVEVDGDTANGPYWFGSYVNYTITVSDQGPDTATGVSISDILDPAELEFISVVSAGQGTFDGATNIWTVGTLADGASVQLTLRTRLVGLGAVVNVAQAATTDQYDSDSTPGNSVPSEDDQDSVSITVVPTSLGDRVWLDLNGDGVQDGTEPGIPDVKVDITWLDPATGAPQSYSTTTGLDGSYGVPLSVGLPSESDITVTIDVANSPNLVGLAPTFDRDGTASAHVSTDQITGADSTLPSGALADLAFDYGYRPDGTQTIGDTIWWDRNNSADDTNGVGEPGIPAIGVTATWAGWDGLFGTADDFDFTTTTDASGKYLFDVVPPGDYTIAVNGAALPSGLTIATYDLDGIGTAGVVDITLDPAETQTDVDFSYRGPGSVGSTLWFDHDGDGSIDAGEPGLGGATVTLAWPGGDGIVGTADDVTLTTVTGIDGGYLFENLPYGDFVVTVDDSTLPGGLVQTYDADGVATANTSSVTLTATNQSNLVQNFGYRGAGSIGDTLFFDVDGTETDGTPDLGDYGIGSIDITVVWAGADNTFGTADDFTFTDTTDVNGSYLVTELPHGSYTVTVDEPGLPTGLTSATYDADGVGTSGVSATTLTSTNPDDLTQDFAYTGTSSGQIGDVVWFDQDGDGNQDAGEVGFSGVTVTLVWFGADGVPGGTDDVVQTTTTDANGAYLFDNLPEGNFSVTVDDTTLPTGLVPTADGDGIASVNTSLVTLNPTNASDFDQDFGYTGLGSLGDTVWYDIDNSGTATADAGEPGLAGVDLTIVWTNPQGSDVTFSVTTDASGAYTLPRLPHGTYTVTVDASTLPAGMVSTFDADGTGTINTSTVALDATSPSNDAQDFSFTGVGSAGDTVWFDQNIDGAPDPAGSGVFDGQDQPLAGIDLVVTWAGPDGVLGDDPATTGVDESADDVAHAATTDAAGEWLVANLPFGPYSVTLNPGTLPSGITVATFDADGVGTANSAEFALDAATPNNFDQDFSYTGAGSVGDLVWFDLNGDGIMNGDDVGLAGVTVTLSYVGPDGTTVTTTTLTGNDGSYTFADLPFDVPLTVTVDDSTLPSGLAANSDSDDIVTPHVSVTTLTSAAPIDVNQDFGYVGLGSIGDTVFYDADGIATDGTPAAGDVGIPNVSVTIVWTNPNGGTDMTTTVTTDANGNYVLPGLPFGDYTVTVDPATLPSGIAVTFDNDGTTTPFTSSVTLSSGTPDSLDQDFAVTGTGSIGDVVWNDENGDGVIDAGETLLEGVTVTLTYVDPVSGLTFSFETVTAAGGIYTFTNLPAGDYTITVDQSTLPEGYGPTYDVDGVETGFEATVSLGDGEDRVDVDFGFRPEADLAIVKSHAADFVIGEENTWTLTVHNDGPSPAAAPIVITDTLPANTTFVEAAGDDWDCDAVGQTVTCTFVDAATGDAIGMANGETSAVDLVVTVSAGAADRVTNTASVTSPTLDSNTTDNTSADEVAVPLSILNIDKVLKGKLGVGKAGTYAITVTNVGPSATRGDVVITDDLPNGLTYKSATSSVSGATCANSAGVVTCTNPGTMNVGDKWVVELTVNVTGSGGTSIVNHATVSGGNDVGGRSLSQATIDGIYADGGVSADIDDVASATVENRPSFLAFTGASSRQIGFGAAALLLVGFGLVGATRRRRLA